MIVKTSGIVLHSLRQGETSLVVRIFTQQYGLQSYLVQGVRKAKARIHQNIFQPLTIVDLVAWHKDNQGLQRIKEIACPEPYRSIPIDIIKTSIAIFLAELLTSTLKKSDTSPSMFTFVKDALLFLDSSTGKATLFHLLFMIQLSRFLGFFPRNNYDQHNCYFNLQEGTFQKDFEGGLCLDKASSEAFFHLSGAGFHDMENLSLPAAARRELLQKTIDYYQLHLEGFKEIRSHIILETVLH